MTENPFIIIPMGKEHIDAVTKLEAVSFYEPWSKNSVESALKNNSSFVALNKEGVVVGHLIFSHIFDEGELLRISVHPLFKRKGLATLLIQTMLDEGKKININHWFLEVRASNSAAISLYEKIGFKVMGRRKSYYPSPHGREDAVTMHMKGK